MGPVVIAADHTQDLGFLGFGMSLPEHVMTNDDWSRLVETSDAWITRRTGIRERRIASDLESTLTFALEASRQALASAGLAPEDIDELVLATDSPEVRSPDTASFLQHELGLRAIPSYDLSGSGCAGYLMAVDLARARLGSADKKILVVGVDVLSKIIDWKDRSTAVLFGDGAGACVMGRGARMAVQQMTAGTDGRYTRSLGMPTGGTSRPLTLERVRHAEHRRVAMDGPLVFREAVRRMVEAGEQVLALAGIEAADVDCVVAHQASLRLVDAISAQLGIERDRFVLHLERYGHLGSAAIPVALCELDQSERLSAGDRVLMLGFGPGFHWGAGVVQVM